jgi:hypothetical protein
MPIMATKSRSDPFKTEYEAARAGLKEWGSNRD